MQTLDRLFAAAYERWSPAAERGELGARRAALLADARGDVVELGAGIGSSLDHLGPEVTSLTLLEPSAPMAERLRAAVARHPQLPPTEVVEAPAEAIPLPDDSADVVLAALVLCTVKDPSLALAEARRVLRPNGRLLVMEHVAGTGVGRVLQAVLEPAWEIAVRGCHLTRDTRAELERAGFDTSELVDWRLPGGGPAAPAIIGTARLR